MDGLLEYVLTRFTRFVWTLHEPIGVAGYSFSSLSVFPFGFSFKEVLMRPGVHSSSLTLSCNLSLG